MSMTRRGFLTTTAALSAVRVSQAAQPEVTNRLLGAWRLLDAVTVHPSGATSPWYDRSGPYSGVITYGESGAMSVQIASARPRAHSPPAFSAMSPVRQLEYLGTYYAYFGRFELDSAGAEIRHFVETSLDPTENGRTYVQKFTLQHGRLTLTTQPWRVGGEWRHSRLVWTHA